MIKNNEYIRARKSQLIYYRDVPLFKLENEKPVLYKPKGMTLSEMRIGEELHPPNLFIRADDKIRGIQEAQKGFNRQLEKNVGSGSSEKVKETLVTIMNETLNEPRSGSLEGVSETIDVLVGDYTKESNVIKNLLNVSYKDYTTILHSINVMAFAIGFVFYTNVSQAEAKVLGLSALLHDVGKTKTNTGLLTAPRKLTDEEFEEMKEHTTQGYFILRECKFTDKDISLAALEHHEKLDGSGYPRGYRRISQISQILGIIDCYEALTNDDRPYRSAIRPYEAFEKIISKDVEAGKFNREIYIQFVSSLK